MPARNNSTSSNHGNNAQGLDALTNPFKLAGRFASGAATSVDDLLRGLGRAGGAVLSDTIAEPVRGVLPGGDIGFWREEEGGDFRSSTYKDLAKPVGESFANTADTIGDLSYLPNVLTEGVDEANKQFGERLQQFNDDPFMFTLEHVGNVSLVGAAASAPARAGLAASRTGAASPGSVAAKSMRPIKGQSTRIESRAITRGLADQAREQGQRFTPEQVATGMGDVVGHPFLTAGSRINRSDFASGFRQGIRSPNDSAPVKSGGRGETPDVDMETPSVDLPESLSGRRGYDVGTAARSIRESPGYENVFAPQVKTGRRIGQSLTRGMGRGVGAVADRVRARSDTPWTENSALGGTNVRTSLDPQHTDNMMARNLRNLERRNDLEDYGDFVEDVNQQGLVDKVRGVGDAARRSGQVLSGKRSAGTSMDPETVHRTVTRVMDEADRRAGNDRVQWDREVRHLMPEIEPIALQTRGLNAIEEMRGLEPGALTGALADTVRLSEDVGQLNIRAQQALRGTNRDLGLEQQGRYQVPDEHLVTLDQLRPDERRVFDEAVNQHLYDQAVHREPTLRENELIPQAGTRSVRDPETGEVRVQTDPREPTQFPEDLEDMPLDTESRRQLRGARRDVERVRSEKEQAEATRNRLLESGQPLTRRRAGEAGNLTYQGGAPSRVNLSENETMGIIEGIQDVDIPELNTTLDNVARRAERSNRVSLNETEANAILDAMETTDMWTDNMRSLGSSAEDFLRTRQNPPPRQPTQASLDRAAYRTRTGQAVDRHNREIARKNEQLVETSGRLSQLEESIRLDPQQAPASAREYLTYASEVAPAQARALRELAEDARQGRVVGDAQVYDHLANELESIPQTLDALNQSGYRLGYLRMVRGSDSDLMPGSASPELTTRRPGSLQRSRPNVDRNFSRDYRARLAAQETEFQNFLMHQEADNWVREAGLAKTGREWLREKGFTDEQMARMSEGDLLNAFEGQGLKRYDPMSIFGFSQQARAAMPNPLDDEFITPFVERSLKPPTQPGFFEKTFLEGIVDPSIRAWKVLALPLRFGWQVNNAVGSAALSMFSGGVSAFDYGKLMRASQRSVRNWQRGITDEVSIPLSSKHVGELRAKLHTLDDADEIARVQQILDEGEIRFNNEMMNQIAEGGLARGNFSFLNDSSFLNDVVGTSSQNILQQYGVTDAVREMLPEGEGRLARGGAWTADRGRNYARTVMKGVDMSYRLNSFTDDAHRALIYMDQMASGADHTQALTQITKALADYNKLSNFEQRWIKRAYPFYPWMRHMAEVVGRSVHPSNINRTVLMTHMLNVLGQPNEWEEMLPDWGGGHIFTGLNEDGTPEFMSTRGLNPFLDVFDPIQQPHGRGLLRPLSPAVQMPAEQVFGIRGLTGQPFSTPGQPFGTTPDELPRPSLPQHLMNQIPQAQLLKTGYRELTNQPTQSYATGEPIYGMDSEGPSFGQELSQYFGVNIQPLDVESMHQREIQNQYREEMAQKRYEEQAEAHPSRSPVEALQDLPLIPGGS